MVVKFTKRHFTINTILYKMKAEIHVGFIGAGGIARSHVYALQSLKFFYDNVPAIVLESVCSATEASRERFARQFGFNKAETEDEFFSNESLDVVFILGPNKVHFEHLQRVLKMRSVRLVYLEKPVCASENEEKEMWRIVRELPPDKKIQIGFQFMQTSAVREMYAFWKSEKLGRPIHFDLKYYHGDYLQKSYRDKRQTRLAPAPEGGAMADLGSHGISMLLAFLGTELQLVNALQGGRFDDVPDNSDLFSSIALVDKATGAVGNLSASRVSSGSGDLVELEIYAEKGMVRYSTCKPDEFEYYIEDSNQWITQRVGSNYKPVTSFPSGHVSPGWLRSLIHAHYIFLNGSDDKSFNADLKHGLEVQRIVRETATYLSTFRKIFKD